MELVCRAHQVVEDGYEFFAGQKLITLFSAPNYGGEFDNAAAMMIVNSDLQCSLQVLKPNNTISTHVRRGRNVFFSELLDFILSLILSLVLFFLSRFSKTREREKTKESFSEALLIEIMYLIKLPLSV